MTSLGHQWYGSTQSVAYCPKCNQVFETDEGFCPYDGVTLEPGTPTSPRIRAISAKAEGLDALAALRVEDAKAEYDKLVGTTLDGRYRIEKKLGEGGMGVVFLGRHTIIEKPVAIKVLKRAVARDHSVVKRFVQEAKAASRIGHPNIVDVTDFGTTPDGMTYSVMEFVEGKTLSAVIKAEGPMPVTRALPIVGQLAKALGAAHDKGIVHRDLKPENIFVISRDGRKDFVKIVDFGIAKVMPIEGQSRDGPRLTRAGSVFGTPEYMAPEQAAGRGDTDRRVDIYALGTILYEMLVGRVPHKGESTVRTLAMQMLDPIVPPREANPKAEISADLERVIMTALAKKREERYSTMADFLADLERVAGGVPLTQPLSPSTGRVAGADERTLIPLPPGADAVPTMPQGGAAGRATVQEPRDTLEDPLTAAVKSRPRPPRKPSKGDPAFVGAGKLPLNLDDDVEFRTGSFRWPIAVVAILLLAGGGAAAYMLTRGESQPSAQGPADAAVVAEVMADAAVAETAADAGTEVAELEIDAAVAPIGPRPHPNHDHHHPRPPRPPLLGGPRKVQIISRPEGASLYIGTTYSGTGDVYLTRPEGTKLTVTCRLPGHKTGSVTVSFDGVAEVYLCQMPRIKHCVRDLKNPFDDCPDDE